MEHDVREFVSQFPTANTRRMLALCEAGTITWAEAYELSRAALASALA